MVKKIKKTLVEQILDKHDIPYTPLFWTLLEANQTDKAARLKEAGIAETDIYKTLAATGDKTGPIIAVLPITEHLSLKKLAAASGNKKVIMLPLKDLQKTTGYVHGANNPVGIWHTKKFPIYFDASAQAQSTIAVSAGELKRSDLVNPQDIAILVGAPFVDLQEKTS
jgi:Cys-tRNA(Pro)/Cys-tRNA(Cys) deacylase